MNLQILSPALVLVLIALVVIPLALYFVFRRRPPAPSDPRKDEALFVSMFPELQPHFHPRRIARYVAERRKRGTLDAQTDWPNPPGFRVASARVLRQKDCERVTLLDASGEEVAAFFYEPNARGAAVRIAPGVMTIDLGDQDDPAVHYAHPKRSFTWRRKRGWRFSTPVAEDEFEADDDDLRWSNSSSASSHTSSSRSDDDARLRGAAAGLIAGGGTFGGGGASADFGEPMPLAAASDTTLDCAPRAEGSTADSAMACAAPATADFDTAASDSSDDASNDSDSSADSTAY